MAIYNENDPFAAAWLRSLIRAGLIGGGQVDELSIKDLRPEELAGHVRAHFFAGIGGWDLALRLAGWPQDRPVWTGSCPCQPFSSAGRRRGFADERHLWPVWRDLIAQCRPPTIFGEQVAGKDGRLWFAGVRADLEALGYAVGAADLCAAGIGSPHIRQRLWWVADARGGRRPVGSAGGRQPQGPTPGVEGRRARGRMANAEDSDGRAEHETQGTKRGRPGFTGSRSPLWLEHAPGDGRIERRAQSDRRGVADGRGAGGLGHSGGAGLEIGSEQEDGYRAIRDEGTPVAAPGPWSGFVWIPCADGKWRRIEPGLAPLAHGISRRVGKLRGYGNAIVPSLGAQFVKAFLESEAHP